mgnify:CR=1 FL=1
MSGAGLEKPAPLALWTIKIKIVLLYVKYDEYFAGRFITKQICLCTAIS